MNYNKYYYNQLNYPKIPYDNKTTSKKETIATSGCGVCSALMVLNNLYNNELMTVKEMAEFSIEHKARDNYGTNMVTLLNSLSKYFERCKYSVTTDINKVIKHLKNGGVAILNQGDIDLGYYNVFSSGGHYVYCYKVTNDNKMYVYDPAYTSKRYKSAPRKNRIVKEIAGKGVVVTSDWVSKACKRYFLIENNGRIKSPYPSMKCNANINKNTYVYNTNETKSNTILYKGQEIELIKTMPVWSVIRYGIDKKEYGVGLVKTKNVEV